MKKSLGRSLVGNQTPGFAQAYFPRRSSQCSETTSGTSVLSNQRVHLQSDQLQQCKWQGQFGYQNFLGCKMSFIHY